MREVGREWEEGRVREVTELKRGRIKEFLCVSLFPIGVGREDVMRKKWYGGKEGKQLQSCRSSSLKNQ